MIISADLCTVDIRSITAILRNKQVVYLLKPGRNPRVASCNTLGRVTTRANINSRPDRSTLLLMLRSLFSCQLASYTGCSESHACCLKASHMLSLGCSVLEAAAPESKPKHCLHLGHSKWTLAPSFSYLSLSLLPQAKKGSGPFAVRWTTRLPTCWNMSPLGAPAAFLAAMVLLAKASAAASPAPSSSSEYSSES